MKRVLVFPGGTEIGLEINKSLRYIKDIELFSVGSDVSNPAPFFYKNHFIIPSIYEKEWINALNAIIERYNINYIFPAYDDIITALARNKERIKANIISSPLKTCLITRSKKKTYKIFENKLPVPKVFAINSKIDLFPVFLKPEKGQGSKDTYLIKSMEELKGLIKRVKDPMILEYLSGKEYTVDCFTDRDKGLLFCEGRERVRIRNGISVNSIIVSNEKFKEFAKIISSLLEFYGAWFFQLKEDSNGVLKLMEIAPRIAGTMAINRVRGINFPLLSIYENERIDIEILINSYNIEIDRALQNKYKLSLSYNTVYLDFDDVLILKGKINPLIIKFLYQCQNTNKSIILLTKHRKNIKETLKKFNICKTLFSKIINLKDFDSKADYVIEKESIFIDDSFQERKQVSDKCNIPTFDLSMIEGLLNDNF
ncbi:MAG: ATP-grasp domain-containing protein [Promethearchaeota archaeon]